MARKKKSTQGHCIYCGLQRKLTRDHVIPLCLFAQPLPPNLITVPACHDCQQEKSRDDDFIRDFLVADLFGNSSPTAKTVFMNKMLKSMSRGSSELAKSVVQNSKQESFYTSGGVYLGEVMAAPLEKGRIAAIVSRIVRGLFYDARQIRVPRDYSFEVLKYQPWDFQQLINKFRGDNINLNERRLGKVFWCGFINANEDPLYSIWLISFYERVFFTARSVG